MDNRFGHKAGNRAGKTAFPEGWSDQKIVDAVRDVIESGDTTIKPAPTGLTEDREGNEWLPNYDYQVTKKAMIDGVEIDAVYKVVDGVAVLPYGFPRRKKVKK